MHRMKADDAHVSHDLGRLKRKKHTRKCIQGSDGKLHVNELEVLAEAVQRGTRICVDEERHWRAASPASAIRTSLRKGGESHT